MTTMTKNNFVLLLFMKLLSVNSAESFKAMTQPATTEIPITVESNITPTKTIIAESITTYTTTTEQATNKMVTIETPLTKEATTEPATARATIAEQTTASRTINRPSIPQINSNESSGRQSTSVADKILPAVAAVLVILFMMFVTSISILIYLRSQRKSLTKKTRLSESFEMSQVTEPELIGLEENRESMYTAPPSILSLPIRLVPFEGEVVRIETKVEGYPPPTVAWYHDGEAIQTDHSIEINDQGSLFFPSIEIKHSGVYKIVASNEFGEAVNQVSVSVMCEGCEGGGDSAAGGSGRPIPVAEFGSFVSEQHADRNKGFKECFERLSSGESRHAIVVSVSAENALKNRFKNIVTYDDNQLVLKPLNTNDGLCSSQYINASYIDGFLQSKRFIAAQGPLPHTVVDFWRMVWQERPSAIVLLTKCVEGGRVKCEQYWPDVDNRYGPFHVINLEQNICADYTLRKFTVANTMSQEEKPFQVTQLHFTSWPDHGVPTHSSPVLSFRRLVNSCQSLSPRPLIVHCSAGVGRTGTYITLDSVLDQIEVEGLVDIDGVIVKARNQRMKMVQTKDQYIFIHDTVLAFLTCGDTQISSTNFSDTLEELNHENSTHQCTGFQYQFNILDQVSPNPAEMNCSTALKHSNKNRGNKYLPVETSRVILRDEQPNYIHAVAVDGYKQKKAYIIAQNPLQSTIRNFWKVITDRKCGVVVMLTHLKENDKEVCAQYWPNEGCSKFGEFTVQMVEEEKMPDFAVRKFLVENTKAAQASQVTQFHVTNWSPDGTCSNLKVITDIIEEVAKVQRTTENNPILVHCDDTVSRSGMFCAIATTIDRCKTEGVVDVFQVVKALRVHKPGAVINVEQYKLIHNALLVYLQSFDNYANFKEVI